MQVTLTYTVPQNLQKATVQVNRLQSVSLEEGSDNELTMLDLTEDSRTVTLDVGPPAVYLLEIVYTAGVRFVEENTTEEAQKGAVRNLWTNRIALQLGVEVTADEPVITP